MHDRILVTRSSMPPMEEYIEEIQELWDSRWLTNMGAKHEQLTARLASLFAVPYASLFCNGHMALELCLKSARSGRRSHHHNPSPLFQPRML